MKSAKIPVFIFILLCSLLANAQRSFERKEKRVVDGFARPTVAMLSFTKQPGLKIGTEVPIFNEKSTWINKRGITQIAEKSRLIAPDLMMYRQPSLHNNWMLGGEYIFRNTNQKGIFWEYAPGLGYSRSYIDQVIYVRKASDKVKRDYTLAQNSAYVTGGVGIGQNMRFNGYDFKVYGRTNGYLFYPINHDFLTKFGLEIGTVIDLN